MIPPAMSPKPPAPDLPGPDTPCENPPVSTYICAAKQGARRHGPRRDAMTLGGAPELLSIREVGMRALARDVSGLIRAVEGGERLVVTRHGDPVAVILSIDEAVEFLIVHSEEFVRARLDAVGGE